MANYICSICGYVYDETLGDPENGVPAGTLFADLPENWVCPLCGAEKTDFNAEEGLQPNDSKPILEVQEQHDDLRALSPMEMSAIFSNLSKGCEKQYRLEEAQLFGQLSEYYSGQAEKEKAGSLAELSAKIQDDLKGYAGAGQTAAGASDRGAMRALIWGEKVTKILSGMIPRYKKNGEALLADTQIYVCDICGFVYIGKTPPEVCPVCKVPSLKIKPVQRG